MESMVGETMARDKVITFREQGAVSTAGAFATDEIGEMGGVRPHVGICARAVACGRGEIQMSNTCVLTVKHALVVAVLACVPIVAVHAESGADAWITMQAQSAVRVDFGTRASAIEVDTSNGLVTLHGNVQSQKRKAKAAEDVRRVPGVVGVRNLLQVVSARSGERMRRSDNAVKADVQSALNADPSLGDSRIAVRSVSNGVVLLSGDAASLSDNVRALRATADRPGVRQVYSEIEAMSSVRADLVDAEDDLIRRGVTKALDDLDARDSMDIRISVLDGVVWLSGSVPTWQGNSSRMYAVRSVTGVRSIMNVLRVDPSPDGAP
jgi:hyperosmotically inducible protein